MAKKEEVPFNLAMNWKYTFKSGVLTCITNLKLGFWVCLNMRFGSKRDMVQSSDFISGIKSCTYKRKNKYSSWISEKNLTFLLGCH